MEEHAVSEPSADASTAGGDKLYSIQPIPGRGLGVVATSKILRGTRIISEPPLFKFPALAAVNPSMEDLITQKLSGLSNDEQREFFSLHNAHPTSKLGGILRTNGFILGSEGTEAGICLGAARINHACNPNTQNTWNANIRRLTVHAVKDIEVGEEITITYADRRAAYASRQRQLKSAYGFDCSCEVCSLPEAQRQQRDRNTEEIARLDYVLGDPVRTVSSPLECFHDARTLLRLLEEEDIGDARVARAYYDAMQVAIAHGDQARAKVFAQRAYDVRIVCEGEESPAAIKLKSLIAEPFMHQLYGTSMRWERSLNWIPHGLGKEEFEEWLWKGT